MASKREESPREVTSVSSPSEPLIGVLLGVLTSMPATSRVPFWSQVPGVCRGVDTGPVVHEERGRP